MKTLLKIILLLAGSFLLCLNFYGEFKTLRSPAFAEVKIQTMLDTPVLLDGDLSWTKPLPNENRMAYFKRISRETARRVGHYWVDRKTDRRLARRYHTLIPWWENYLLAALDYVVPDYYRLYQYYNHKKIFERGIGICSQQALAAHDILLENGFESGLLPLSGHHMATARAEDGSGVILDASYGVVLPFGFEEINKNPGIISPYYQAAGINQAIIAHLETIFSGNVIPIRGSHRLKRGIEDATYLLKWALPVFMILAALLLGRKKSKPRSGSRKGVLR